MTFRVAGFVTLLVVWPLCCSSDAVAASASDAGNATAPGDGRPDVYQVTITGDLTFRVPKEYLSPIPPATLGQGPFKWGGFEFSYKMPGPRPLAFEENGDNVWRRQREIRAEGQYRPVHVKVTIPDHINDQSQRQIAEHWEAQPHPENLRNGRLYGMDHYYTPDSRGDWYESFFVVGHAETADGRNLEIESAMTCVPGGSNLCGGDVVAQGVPFVLRILVRRDDAENFPADVGAAMALARDWYQPKG